MTENTRPLPPPAHTPMAPSTRLPHPVALFAVAAGLGLVAAMIVGFVAAALVTSSTGCSPNDGWCDLGAALMGIFIGIVVGAITYIVAGVITIARFRPRGSRSGHILVHIGFPFALIVLAALRDAAIS